MAARDRPLGGGAVAGRLPPDRRVPDPLDLPRRSRGHGVPSRAAAVAVDGGIAGRRSRHAAEPAAHCDGALSKAVLLSPCRARPVAVPGASATAGGGPRRRGDGDRLSLPARPWRLPRGRLRGGVRAGPRGRALVETAAGDGWGGVRLRRCGWDAAPSVGRPRAPERRSARFRAHPRGMGRRLGAAARVAVRRAARDRSAPRRPGDRPGVVAAGRVRRARLARPGDPAAADAGARIRRGRPAQAATRPAPDTPCVRHDADRRPVALRDEPSRAGRKLLRRRAALVDGARRAAAGRRGVRAGGSRARGARDADHPRVADRANRGRRRRARDHHARRSRPHRPRLLLAQPARRSPAHVPAAPQLTAHRRVPTRRRGARDGLGRLAGETRGKN